MNKVALITGGAKRIGAKIGEVLHHAGFDVIIHYAKSERLADELAGTLNAIRPNSAHIIKADLSIVDDKQALERFKNTAIALFGRVDVLVHNASSFYPSDFHDDWQTLQQHWQDLFLTNAKAPLFLSHAFGGELANNHGAIISLLDIHARDKPFVGYPIYNMAKSAHLGLVQSLALELAPRIRVNGVSPGVNIFPDDDQNSALNSSTKDALTSSIPLEKIGTPQDIAQAVLFLINAPYITGQVIAVDGGRSLTLKGG